MVKVVLTCLVLLASAPQAYAQLLPATAMVKTTTGTVEILRRGQAQWTAAGRAEKLGQGDEIRTGSKSSAELELPDTTNILVAENTRLAVSKLVMDGQSQNRMAVFHLAVGKVKAAIAQSSVQLVRARQSNFAITTPGGVAATRGTTVVSGYDPVTATTLVAVVNGEVIFIDFATKTAVTIGAANFITQTGNQPPSGFVSFNSLPANVRSELTTPSNPGTIGNPNLTGTPKSVPFNDALSAIVAGLVKASPGDAAAIVSGLVAADPSLADLIVAAAIGAGGDATEVVSAAIGAGGDKTKVVAAAIGAGANADVVRAAAAATGTGGVGGIGGGTLGSPSTLGRNQQVCTSGVCQ